MHRPALDIYSDQMVESDRQSAAADLSKLFRDKAAIPTSTSPTAMDAWEGALSNVLSRGDKVLVLESKCRDRLGQHR